MSKSRKKVKAEIVVADDPEDRKGKLKRLGGSQSDSWNNLLANQAMGALWLKHSDCAVSSSRQPWRRSSGSTLGTSWRA